MTPDQERWAEALAIKRMHGDQAEAWVADRMTALSASGDYAGVERFRLFLDRLGQLDGGTVQ